MRWIYSKSSCLERVNKGPALRPLGFRIFAFNPHIITVRKLLATPIKKKEKKKENTFLGSSWTGVIICRKLCRWIWDHSTQINELPVYTRASLFSLPLLLTSRLTLQSALLPSQDLNPMKYSTQGCARCSELLLEIRCLYFNHVWNISYRWESEVLNDKENNVSVRWWW